METLELPKMLKATKTEANKLTFGVAITSDDGPNVEVTCSQLKNMLHAWFIAFAGVDRTAEANFPDGRKITYTDQSIVTKAVSAALADVCAKLEVADAPRKALVGGE